MTKLIIRLAADLNEEAQKAEKVCQDSDSVNLYYEFIGVIDNYLNTSQFLIDGYENSEDFLRGAIFALTIVCDGMFNADWSALNANEEDELLKYHLNNCEVIWNKLIKAAEVFK